MRHLLLIAIAACNPYSPDFGPAPFLCGETEPRCPEGYFCVEQTDGRQVCSDTAPDDFDCVADPNEPNDTAGTATALESPATRGGLAVCPNADLDVYSVAVPDGGSLEVLVTFETGGAVLEAQILDPDGEAFASAALLEGTTIRAFAEGLPAATYFVQVAGPAAGALTVNNYSLTVQ